MFTEPTDGVLGDLAQVRIATRQQIWARFPNQILQSLCGHPDTCEGHHQAQPARVPFPKFVANRLRDRRLRSIGASSARGKHPRADHDNGSRRKQRNQNEGLGRDSLVRNEGIGDGPVGEGKGVVVGNNLVESIADHRDAAVVRVSMGQFHREQDTYITKIQSTM